MSWFVLVLSGVLEAVWAVALGRSEGFSRVVPTVVFGVALLLSMGGLAYAMRELPTGTAYAVWVGIGATLTVAYGMISGTEPVSALRVLLLGMIVAEVSALADQEQKLAEVKQDLQDKADAAQALVLQLTEQQRAELEAAEGGTSTFDASELDSATVNAKIIAAIKYATSKVPNSQYVWGASGPNGFDCSGLMLASYRSVGISLPHSSRSQASVGRAVSKDELKPGDLIFWYHPIHHVGMYIGNGKIVHARNTRSDLVIQTLASYPAPWAGARRVIG